MRRQTTSEKTLMLAVTQGAAGAASLGHETARRALSCARTRRDRANALDLLARVEPSPFVRYRFSRELARLRPTQPHVWALLHRSAIDCGFHRAAEIAKERYAATKAEWNLHEQPRIAAEWERIRLEDPELYARIKTAYGRGQSSDGHGFS